MPKLLLHTSPKQFDSLTSWSDSVCQHFVPLEVEPRQNGAFHNRATIQTLGCLQVSELVVSAQRVRRTHALANRSEDRQFKFSIQLSGQTEIIQAKRTALLGPGDWGLYDTSQPYELSVNQSAHFLVLQVEAAQMAVWMPYLQQSVALCFSSNKGSARVALDTLLSLARQSPSLSAAATRDISMTVLQLIGLNLCEQSGRGGMSDLDEVRQGQLRVILQYIHDNLHESDLSVNTLAQRFRMSRRYLYNLFASRDLSPADYVLSARLERCRDMLADPACSRSMGELAYLHGFADASAFSHAFRRRYALSPTEWRRQHT
ncbi:helix-turn-helix domain-containing protein [Alcaligenaceae bacterium CGII-47]|nr:helix-turn-helix domain-containing protein [Alcaligenaceae bacterium CGII-47]